MMTNGDPEGQIFISYPHKNNGFSFPTLTRIMDFLSCSPLTLFQNKLPEV